MHKKSNYFSRFLKQKKKPINYFKLYKTYAEFKIIAKRDKKAFFKERCKEVGKKIVWERLEIFSR